jgi:deoxyribodipyrimidine photolyase-like uncharacterized protein
VSIFSNSILANQPYGTQGSYTTPTTKYCTDDEYDLE